MKIYKTYFYHLTATLIEYYKTNQFRAVSSLTDLFNRASDDDIDKSSTLSNYRDMGIPMRGYNKKFENIYDTLFLSRACFKKEKVLDFFKNWFIPKRKSNKYCCISGIFNTKNKALKTK